MQMTLTSFRVTVKVCETAHEHQHHHRRFKPIQAGAGLADAGLADAGTADGEEKKRGD